MKEGWEIKTLGEVCEVMNGGTPKTGVPMNWDGSHLWITPAEMGKRLTPYISNTERKLTDFGLRDSSARMLPPKSVILSSRAPIGHLVINTEPMATNQGCKGLIPRSQLHYKYLYYYLLSIVDLLNSLGTGATFKELSGGKLKEVTIPFSVLTEQLRIVAILDEAFEGIATAKANAEKNLKNARQLFESHLNSVFSQRGEGWVEKRLGQVCQTGAGGTPLKSKKAYYEGGTIPWLLSGEVSQGQIHKAKHFISQQGLENSSAKIFPKNTVLVAMYGATAGQVGILKFEASTNQAVCGILPNDRFVPEYLFYFFLSQKDSLVAQAEGNAQPNISQLKIKNTAVPILSLSEQQEIVERFDFLRNQTQSPRGSIQNSQAGSVGKYGF